MGGILAGVAAVDAATVEQGNIAGGGGKKAAQGFEDGPAHDLGGGLGRGGLAGPDGPDRLVGDYQAGGVADSLQSRPDLAADDVRRPTLFSLLQGLANAHDGLQSGCLGRLDLVIDRFIGLAEHLAALRVTQYNVVAEALKHARRYFAGESAGFLEVHILGANFDCGARNGVSDCGQRDKRRAKHQVHTFYSGHSGPVPNSSSQGSGLRNGGVHLPVSSDDQVGHCLNSSYLMG